MAEVAVGDLVVVVGLNVEMVVIDLPTSDTAKCVWYDGNTVLQVYEFHKDVLEKKVDV